MKKSFLLLLALSLCSFPGTSVRAEDLSLKIQAFPDQNSVKTGMMFLVRVEVENTSADTSKEFWGNSCSYEKHWVTDNSIVFIQSWTCDENTLEQITLEPGLTYDKNIILYISKKDKTEPVSFRLGFKRMSEDGDVAEPLWSDPVTINVIVPEGIKEAPEDTDSADVAESPETDDAASEAVAVEKTEDEESEIIAPAGSIAEKKETENPEAAASEGAVVGKEEADETEPVSEMEADEPEPVVSEGDEVEKMEADEPEPVVPAVSQPLVFQDPGVPVTVAPGQEFSISLGSNPSTGFRWKMTLPSGDKTVMFLSSRHVASQEVVPGVPGNELFTFKALTKGETKAAFVYERPWETKTAPTRKIFTIRVQES